MQAGIQYWHTSERIEIIHYSQAALSYPMHTHTNHMMLGYVTDGSCWIKENGRECRYDTGDFFCVLPDIPHALRPDEEEPYSMISLCIRMEKEICEEKIIAGNPYQLQDAILQEPEKAFPIEDMARRVCISPYYMIRRFKDVCGLTPHQFQIQCRIRKAQKLLEEGKSVTEVAYETGFCDQSHFDRCFRKLVQLTPSEYRKAVRHPENERR